MAAADSETVFFARVAELGLGDLKPKFVENGWKSFSDFAFACSDFKNSDPNLFNTEVVKPLVAEAKDRIPRIRRLYMQSYVIGSAEMERYANPQPDTRVAMHPADRGDALDRLSKRMTGFTVAHASEPSHALIDKCATIVQKGVVRYIPWEKCTSRDEEILDESEEPGLKLNAEGVFVQTPAKGPDADVSGELRWDLALRRRCLAMDVAGLCSFEAGVLWHEAMKAAYLASPPPGYRRVTWAQLLNADRALFKKVSEDCPNGCKAKPGETVTDFEKAWKKAAFNFEVRLVMQALPCPSGSHSITSSPASFSFAAPPDFRMKKLENKLKSTEDQLRSTKRKLENQNTQWPRSKGGKGQASGTRRQVAHRQRCTVRPH